MDLPKAWIEAGAVAICERAHQHGSWDRVSDEIRASCMAESHACLSAVFGRAEVVASNGSGSGSDYRVSVSMESMGPHVGGVELAPFELRRGDTLVIVRGW